MSTTTTQGAGTALVTGGAGFIGSNLVGALVARGTPVVVLDSLVSGYRSNLDAFPSVRFLDGDVRYPAAADAAMNGYDLVFHPAASVGNKPSIELESIEWEVAQMHERTLSRSKIVDRNRSARRVDLRENRKRAIHIAQKRRFGNLDFKQRRVNSARLQRRIQHDKEIRMHQMARGDVHAESRFQSARVPLRKLSTRLL